MNNDALRTLKEVEGVAGVFMTDQEQRLVENTMPPNITRDALVRAGNDVNLCWEGVESAPGAGHINLLQFEFDKHYLFVKKLSFFTVGALTQKEISLADLSITFNVAGRALQEHTQKSPVETVSPQNLLKNPERLITEVVKKLALFIGPLARVVVDEKLKEMNLSSSRLSKSDAVKLINVMSKEIDNRKQASEFSQIMMNYIESTIG